MLRYITCPKCSRRSAIRNYRCTQGRRLSWHWTEFQPIKEFVCGVCFHKFEACVYVKGKCTRCKKRVDCLAHNVTVHVDDWFEYETEFHIPGDKELDRKASSKPNNFRQPPIHVMHRWLTRSHDAPCLAVLCPRCGGILTMRRDSETFKLLDRDRCLLCAQEYIFTDIEELQMEPDQ